MASAPSPASQSPSPENFWCSVCTGVRHHLLTGWPAPADCGPSQLPAERCCRRCLPHFAIRCTQLWAAKQTPLWQSQIYLDSPPSAALYITPTKFGWTTNTLCYLDNYTLQFGQADFSKAYLPPLSRSLYCSCLNQLGRRSTASMEFGLFSKTSNILASACSSLLLLKSQLPILVRPSQFSAPPRFAQFVGGLPTTS